VGNLPCMTSARNDKRLDGFRKRIRLLVAYSNDEMMVIEPFISIAGVASYARLARYVLKASLPKPDFLHEKKSFMALIGIGM